MGFYFIFHQRRQWGARDAAGQAEKQSPPFEHVQPTLLRLVVSLGGVECGFVGV